MGLVYHQLRGMLAAREGGASFDRVITLGHLKLFVHSRELRTLSREFGLPMDVNRPAWAGEGFGDYSDAFFRECLGTTELQVLDVSDYQGATVIHDLNKPIADEWRQRFDAVVDGGTLEHIFDVPEALANMMRLACVGGRIFSTSPANNLCGHGFYQLSPELMFRAFGASQGFRPLRVELVQLRYPGAATPARAAYSVRDPEAVGERVGLVSRTPTVITVEAAKIEHLDEPFAVPPQQSDYLERWRLKQGAGPSRLPEPARLVVERLPTLLRMHLRGLRSRWRNSFRNRRAYSPLP